MPYPDFKEVVYLLGSSNLFQLDKYKHDLAKTHSQILIYLCMLLRFEKEWSSSGEINISSQKVVKYYRGFITICLMSFQSFTEI